jgi:hypothetical protein
MKKFDIMKKLSLVLVLIAIFLGNSVYANSTDITKTLIEGKWINKSGGYKLNENSDKTIERYKAIKFEENRTFVLDSIKVKYSGEWNIIGNEIYLEFSNSSIKTKIATITDGKLHIGKNTFKSHSGAYAGLINFYEFTGFPNATLGHIIMVLVGIFFIFLAIRYNYEPLLLIPIGVGIILVIYHFFRLQVLI